MKIDMPEDGWDERAVEYFCDKCNRTLIAESVFLNLDWLIKEGLTQVEFFRSLHDGEHAEADRRGITMEEWWTLLDNC